MMYRQSGIGDDNVVSAREEEEGRMIQISKRPPRQSVKPRLNMASEKMSITTLQSPR